VIRCLASAIGLLLALAPAWAQTNLDQGKSAAQIFAADCVECHKAPHGLANGKDKSALTEFLREHYTTSREQAAALAAYVLGGRGSEPIGASAQGKKPPAEESKPPKRQAQKPPKPEEGASTEAEPQRPSDAAAKPKADGGVDEPPSFLRAIVQPEGRQRGATTRTRREEQPKATQRSKPPVAVAPASTPATAPAPAPLLAAPTPTETPSRPMSPTAAAPSDATSSEPNDAPVPRDNIPD
jgi:cytochrome c553